MRVAKTSLLCLPSSTPTARITSFSSLETHLIGPCTQSVSMSPNNCLVSSSNSGCMPNSHSWLPPNRFGRSSSSMYFVKVDVTSEADRIKILDVVAGSNHFVMNPQMVGKKAGAPMIYIATRNKHKLSLGPQTEASIQLTKRSSAVAGKME
jgi:hypothetical protein